MLCDETLGDQSAGSTAVTILIKDNKLYCANAGDSRAVACIDGNVSFIFFLFLNSKILINIFKYFIVMIGRCFIS